MIILTQTQKKLTAIFLINLLNACSYPDNPATAISTNELKDNTLFSITEKIFDKTGYFKPVPLEQVEIIVQESFPIQVNVIAKGELPNDCMTIDQITEKRKDNLFTIELLTQYQPNRICTALKKPYEEIISLEVDGLKAGIYAVKVNQISKAFELGVDN